MVAAPSSPISQSLALEMQLKSKGIRTLDDLDAPEEEPLLQLQGHHNLVFIVELCQAQRPSKLGSLKGSHEKYMDEFSRLQNTVSELNGDGTVEVIQWEAGMPIVPSSSSMPPPPAEGGGRRSRPQSAGPGRGLSSRPQSAAANSQNARLRAYMGLSNPQERLAPRIGAFEVSYKLVNTQSGSQYGPVEIFSKIASGHWPGSPSLILKRVQEQLQGFLQRDLGAGMLYQHVRARPIRTPRILVLSPARARAVPSSRARQPPHPHVPSRAVLHHARQAQTLAKESKPDARPRRLERAEDLPDE